MAATILGATATTYSLPQFRDTITSEESIRLPPQPPIMSKLYQQIISSSFTGATGLVEFSPKTGTRKATAINYGLLNVQPAIIDSGQRRLQNSISLPVVRISQQQGQWQNAANQCFQFVGGSCTVPQQLNPPPTEYDYIGLGLRVLGWVLMGLTYAFCVGITYWIVRFRKKKILRASQPGFLLMLVGGVAIYISAIFPYTVDGEWINVNQGDTAWCMASYWLAVEGFVVTFSALFAKVWRINRIFHNPSLRRIKITAKDVLLPFFIICFCSTLTLILFTVLPNSAEYWNVERTFDDFGTVIKSSGSCTTTTNSDIFIGVLYGIQVLVLLLACWQYYVARKISVEYSESTWISYAVLSVLQVMIISIPLEYMDTGTNSKFFVNIFKITIISWSILGFIFLPKILYLYNDRKEKKGKGFGVNKMNEEEKKNLHIKNKARRGLGSQHKSTRSSVSSSSEGGARFVVGSTYLDNGTGKIEKGKSYNYNNEAARESKAHVFNQPISPPLERRGSPQVGFVGDVQERKSPIVKEIVFEKVEEEKEDVGTMAPTTPPKKIELSTSYGDGSPF